VVAVRAKFLIIAAIPALLSGYAAHSLLGYRPVPAVLVAGVVLMALSELLRVFTSRDL